MENTFSSEEVLCEILKEFNQLTLGMHQKIQLNEALL